MIPPTVVDLEVEQYAQWSRSFRYGTSNPETTWYSLEGWTGYGAFTIDETPVPITVAIAEETVEGEGGTIALSIDPALPDGHPPGSYRYDVWLKPPGEPAFKWLKGPFVVNPSQAAPP
jgi:hypothetical protein